ncbi:MAG: DUF3800 domain-containing protein [bacterium]
MTDSVTLPDNGDLLPTRRPCLYVFLDEGGNLDFSPSGTQYLSLSSISTVRPFFFDPPLIELRYDLIESGLDMPRFHAAEDRQVVRDQVFQSILAHNGQIHVDSIIVDKTQLPDGMKKVEHLYPVALTQLLKELVLPNYNLGLYAEVIVITDTLPVDRRRKAVEKGIKQTLAAALSAGTRYRIYHHSSASCMGLQVADYCNWAIYRKWQSGDARSHNTIQRLIRHERQFASEG